MFLQLTPFYLLTNFFLLPLQAVFEPPYNPIVVTCGVIGVVCTGYGMMYFGMRHQQYKQGYWK